MLVRDIMNKNVLTADPDTSVIEAARTMADNHVGSLVVVKDGSILGIVTERDILLSLADIAENILDAKIGDVMTHYVIVIEPDAKIEKAVRMMKDNGIKKIPVVADEKLVGIITASDIIAAEPEMIRDLSAQLRKKI